MIEDSKVREPRSGRNMQGKQWYGARFDRQVNPWKLLLLFVYPLSVEAVAILIYAVNSTTPAEFLGKASIGLILAGGLILFGSILGFVVVIPHPQIQPAKPRRSSQAASRSQYGEIDAGTSDYRANTNLVEISDWLTKILVGVGLTQFREVRTELTSLTEFVALGLGSSSQAKVFAFALLSYSTVLGFVFGFLCTRILLPSWFSEADRNAIENLTVEIKNMAHKIYHDEDAMALVSRQLDNASAEVDAKDLNAAVAATSPTVKDQIFKKTMHNVQQNCIHDLPKMARSIPVYRALIASDAEKIAHEYHAQLAFALYQKIPSDSVTAETEYDTAIEIRNRLKEDGVLLYEYGRALARMSMPADPQRTQQIRGDLRAASRDDILKERMAQDVRVTKWLQDNQLTVADITG